MFILKTNQETLHTIDVFFNDFKICSFNTHILTYMIDNPVFYVIYSRCSFSSNPVISQNAQSEGNLYYDKQSFLDFLSSTYPLFTFSMPYDDLYYTLKSQFENFELNQFICPVLNFKTFISDVDFVTNLYSELLDNEETKLQLRNWIDDTGSTWEQYTDKDIKAMELIEKYNKNVLLLRSTRKVDANVSGSISSSSSESQVDLSALNANTSRIADNLQMLDDNQNVKSITKVIDDKNNDQQVVVTTVEKAPYNPLLEDDEF